MFACLCFREEQEEQEEDVLAAIEAGVGAPLLLWDVGGNSDHLQKCGLLMFSFEYQSTFRRRQLNCKSRKSTALGMFYVIKVAPCRTGRGIGHQSVNQHLSAEEGFAILASSSSSCSAAAAAAAPPLDKLAEKVHPGPGDRRGVARRLKGPRRRSQRAADQVGLGAAFQESHFGSCRGFAKHCGGDAATAITAAAAA